ncbi:DUF2059 domain-containing protein [Sphingomonas sanguinis]|jgi:hypothetical protein|uniref:DUF2059 domain-containing protein n=1 Tax=Sphingomonas sanguinis TaxID=33051 RepID=A0A7Y7QW76_9SPHN|nr:DUF2059 domain-containing protein [Sphingomonas sanguinis]MBZ6381858.1 DUF2059 domain-containing protein [Sphingomonas sanguinis]NNG49307.1 DUF2059 domain-containing protein [Sphingomonas sanguinis]NNG54085.1 DUF2059 domain-containing protein [Sphingomonas sanguinis]NVP31158.1 DUF2059 domain-containing protein [Sphingomonas sanguinis]
MLASGLGAMALMLGGAMQTAPVGEAASRPAALTLARLLYPEALVVKAAGTDGMVAQLLASDPRMKAREDRHPGIVRAMAQAVQPLRVRSMRERMPVLWQRQAAIYGAAFTEPELATLNRFYASPPGQALVATMQSGTVPPNETIPAGLVDRVRALRPRTEETVLTWIMEEQPWEWGETEKAVAGVMTRFGESGE